MLLEGLECSAIVGWPQRRCVAANEYRFSDPRSSQLSIDLVDAPSEVAGRLCNHSPMFIRQQAFGPVHVVGFCRCNRDRAGPVMRIFDRRGQQQFGNFGRGLVTDFCCKPALAAPRHRASAENDQARVFFD